MERMDTEEYLKHWENIVESVDKTDIPIRFVSRIIFDSDFYDIETDSQTNQIDVLSLRAAGYPEDSLQEIINQVIKEIAEFDGTMDFLLDIEEIAHIAGEITNRYLQRI